MLKPIFFSLTVTAAVLAGGCMSDGDGKDERSMMRQADSRGAGDMDMKSMKRVDRAEVDRLTENWPEPSKKALMMMMEKYGPPHEATATHVMWWNNGPWKWTKISSMPVQHAFPMPHPDVLEQAIDYRVPPEMFDELAMYDGSVIVERTKGEMSARCDKESANFLALNLAHEIVTGKRSVSDARMEYARQIKAMMNKQPAPYTERLMFEPMKGGSADPDHPAER